MQWLFNGEMIVLWANDLGTTGYIHSQVTETGPKSHTLYKHLRKITKWTIRPSVKSKTISLFEKKKSSGPSVGQNDFCHDIKAQSTKNKIFHQE